MSAPKILAQSLCPLISLGGLWVRPVLCRLKLTCGAADAVTIDTDNTSPGLSATEAAGVFSMTFPTCRRAQVHSGNVAPATPGTAANHRDLQFDEPNASAGTLTFRAREDDTASAVAAPNDGSVVTVLIWLDLG